MPKTSSLSRSLADIRRRTRGLSSVAAVATGGLLGSAARTGIGAWIPTSGTGFPTAVVSVNLTGSLLIGLFLARRERAVGTRLSLHFWAIGVLGSFTTFSTFSIDLFEMLSEGRQLTALSYLAASIFGGLGMALGGQRIGAAIR